jgi:hypothetical protein
MQRNEWSTLPLPVFDRLLRQGFSFADLCSMGLACTAWRAAVFVKVPHTAAPLAAHAKRRKEKKEKKERKQREKEAQRRQRLRDARRRRVGMSACTYVLSAPLFAAGLTGLLFFLPLFRSVSIVPDCEAADALRVSLLCCCAFWLFDSFLVFLWSLSFFVPPSEEVAVVSFEDNVFDVCNAIGVVSNCGLWCSAAACVSYCSQCIDVNPVVVAPVRAYAGTSLALGAVLSCLCLYLTLDALRYRRYLAAFAQSLAAQ